MLRGCDVSFKSPGGPMKAAGLSFALSECSIGSGENASWRTNVPEWQANGLLASAYHFCIYSQVSGGVATGVPTDPVAQANTLCDRLQAGPQLDFPCAIDIEQPLSANDTHLPGMTGPQIIAWLEQHIDTFVSRMHYFPLFYTYPSYAKMLGPALPASSVIGKCPLWIADGFHGMWPADGTVTVVCNPKSQWFLGGPWNDFAMMQTVGNAAVGSVPPIQTIVDTDVFNGTEDDLRALSQTGGSIFPSGIVSNAAAKVGLAAAAAALAAGGVWAYRNRKRIARYTHR